MISDKDGILHRRIVKEEHITITAEPEGKYLSHFTPEEPTYPEKPALKEAEGLYNILHNIGAIESCLVWGGDSTARNTRKKVGSICPLKKTSQQQMSLEYRYDTYKRVACETFDTEIKWAHYF